MGQYLCRRVAGDSEATRPGSSVAAGQLLPGSDLESGTSSDFLLKPNVASWVSGEARYGSEVAIMKRAPPPQTGGGDRMKPSTMVTVHRGRRGVLWWEGAPQRRAVVCRRLHSQESKMAALSHTHIH